MIGVVVVVVVVIVGAAAGNCHDGNIATAADIFAVGVGIEAC